MQTRRKSTGPSSAVVEGVLERAQWCCEGCGSEVGDRRGEDWSVHHRRPRQMGGTRWAGINLPSNLMILCGSGVTGCHGTAESERFAALANGWLVHSGQDPAHVKVHIGGSWVYLGDEYEYRVAP
jgi:5-methylcytosine-specific restriction protein A